jgi:hypothetical protein
MAFPHQCFKPKTALARLVGAASAQSRTPADPTKLDGSRMGGNPAPLDGIGKIGQSSTPQTVENVGATGAVMAHGWRALDVLRA